MDTDKLKLAADQVNEILDNVVSVKGAAQAAAIELASALKALHTITNMALSVAGMDDDEIEKFSTIATYIHKQIATSFQKGTGISDADMQEAIVSAMQLQRTLSSVLRDSPTD